MTVFPFVVPVPLKGNQTRACTKGHEEVRWFGDETTTGWLCDDKKEQPR